MFLDNLKPALPGTERLPTSGICWNRCIPRWDGARILQIAIHLTNLIKNSETVTVRRYAAQVLFQILPDLTSDCAQRADD